MPKKAKIMSYFKFWGNKLDSNIWINLIMYIHICVFTLNYHFSKNVGYSSFLSLLFHHRRFAFYEQINFVVIDFSKLP